MTVVDVNTGKYTGSENRRNTFLRVNLEAVAETARQLRLRDIGGIVVIDALRMGEAGDQREVIGALETELAKDRQKTAVAGFTRLGLLEMTRKTKKAGMRGQARGPSGAAEGPDDENGAGAAYGGEWAYGSELTDI